jgi:hypothetical protein
MQKILVLAISILLMCGAAATPKAMNIVKLDAAVKKQPAVRFDHDKHALKLVKTCVTCHHTTKGLTAATAAKAKVEKCSACHLDPKGNVPSMRDASLQKNPYHSLCLGCHKKVKKGATTCVQCHKK